MLGLWETITTLIQQYTIAGHGESLFDHRGGSNGCCGGWGYHSGSSYKEHSIGTVRDCKKTK